MMRARNSTEKPHPRDTNNAVRRRRPPGLARDARGPRGAVRDGRRGAALALSEPGVSGATVGWQAAPTS